MSLSPEDVQRIALLARLEIPSSELPGLTKQMTDIVSLVEQLQSVDTTGVEPLVHAIELENVLVPDEVRPGLDRKDALKNSPDHDQECFRVPAVLG